MVAANSCRRSSPLTSTAPFVPEAYREPDPATLAVLTRQAIAQMLGRTPSADEIAAVRGNLGAWLRESYDIEQAEARRQHEIDQDLRIAAAQQTAGIDAYGRPIPVNVHGGPASSGLDPNAPVAVAGVDPGGAPGGPAASALRTGDRAAGAVEGDAADRPGDGEPGVLDRQRDLRLRGPGDGLILDNRCDNAR